MHLIFITVFVIYKTAAGQDASCYCAPIPCFTALNFLIGSSAAPSMIVSFLMADCIQFHLCASSSYAASHSSSCHAIIVFFSSVFFCVLMLHFNVFRMLANNVHVSCQFWVNMPPLWFGMAKACRPPAFFVARATTQRWCHHLPIKTFNLISLLSGCFFIY